MEYKKEINSIIKKSILKELNKELCRDLKYIQNKVIDKINGIETENKDNYIFTVKQIENMPVTVNAIKETLVAIEELSQTIIAIYNDETTEYV
jgi:hypothetical protein